MSTLSEAESKRRLARVGVPVVADAVCATPADTVEAARSLGFPVAIKLTGDAVTHKTERGLVRLAVADGDAVLAAAVELLDAARPEDGDVALLVAPMVRGTRELIAGLHTDPQFGRCVMVGIGGVLAEAIADVSFRLAPISAIDAADMIDDLRAQRLLGALRGEPPVDRDALAGVLLGLSALAEAEPEVVSVDVNPLIVVDGRPVAVDALVELE